MDMETEPRKPQGYCPFSTQFLGLRKASSGFSTVLPPHGENISGIIRNPLWGCNCCAAQEWKYDSSARRELVPFRREIR